MQAVWQVGSYCGEATLSDRGAGCEWRRRNTL